MNTKTDNPMNKRALAHAGYNLWMVIAIASIFMHVMILFDTSIARLITGETSEPQRRQLLVKALGYQPETGMIYQQVQPAQPLGPIQSEWAAHIIEVSPNVTRFVCGTGGVGSYDMKTEPVYLTPDQWTGDVCDMVYGRNYLAKAQWTWKQPDGSVETVAASFEFVYQPQNAAAVTE